MGFLGNLVKVFPSLATRPLHITGESYAGQYIVRRFTRSCRILLTLKIIIAIHLKGLFRHAEPSRQSCKNIYGGWNLLIWTDIWTPTCSMSFMCPGIIQDFPLTYHFVSWVYLPHIPKSLVTTKPCITISKNSKSRYMHTYALAEMLKRTNLCGFNISLQYPQNGIIPDVNFTFPTERVIPFAQMLSRKTFKQKLTRRIAEESASISLRKREDRELASQNWKRDLSLRTNGTIDPWVRNACICIVWIELTRSNQYGCFLLDMFIDYALNYTFPWSTCIAISLTVYTDRCHDRPDWSTWFLLQCQ